MAEHTVVVGVVLLAVVPFVVVDAVGGMRAGFDSAFWARPLDEKLDRIPAARRPWERLGIVWLFVGLLLTGALTAFTFQLSEQGEGVLAALGLGVFLPAAAAFLPLVAMMVAAASTAADRRSETGETPAWLHPVWNAAWWLERCFVVGANLAYVAWGWAMVASGFPAEWAGWVAIVSGAAIAAWASLRDYFFQHMVLFTPIVVGVALILY